MAKRKLSPLVQAMNIFNEMDERDKITLSDYIRSQTVRKKADSPKSFAPSVAKKSSQKFVQKDITASTEGDKESVTAASDPQTVSVPMCAICAFGETYFDHQKSSPNYHIFRTSLKTKKSNAAVLPDKPEDFQHGATA